MGRSILYFFSVIVHGKCNYTCYLLAIDLVVLQTFVLVDFVTASLLEDPMPLLKRKPFPLASVPQDLKTHELVFQVRFTKEIFRDYKEYLQRINLYRQRLWTCKVTGKTNLTYEEALVSEHRATEKAQQFPKELIVPVLQMIQFSTMRLKDLISTVSSRLLEHFLEGEEIYYRKEDSVVPCKIMKILEKTEGGNMSYEVGWLDKHKKVSDTSSASADKLMRKKPPFSRQMLKTFIRESTMQSSPWIVHETLAQKYGLPTEMPDELRDKINAQTQKCNKIVDRKKRNLMENGNLDRKKRSKTGDGHADVLGEAQKETYSGKPTAQNTNIGRKKRIKADKEFAEVSGAAKKEPISAKDHEKGKVKIDSVNGETKLQLEPAKYPIEDLLVQPCPGDPKFKDRPAPSTDFAVSMNCVGNLLMVWDFCSSFSRMLCLWPFSLEDFENAVSYKGSNVNLIIEAHAAILRLLLKDEGDYYNATRRKRRKSEITFMNWTEYLCDFLEMEDVPELSGHISTIKRGHYGLLDTHAKLDIFQVLVNYALTTDMVREQLEEYIEQRQILGATNREAAVEEARKRRKQQEVLKEAVSDAKGKTKGEGLDNDVEGNVDGPEVGTRAEDASTRKLTSNGHQVLENGNIKHTSRSSGLTQKMDGKVNVVKQKKSTAINRGNEEKQFIKKGLEEKKQRLQQFEREIEKCFIRTNPLGKDRNYSRYWFFRREGRVFVENSDFEQWGYYSTKEEIDQLIGSLNPKGERERALQRQLLKHYGRICSALQKRSKEIAQRFILEEAELRRSARVKSQPKESLGPAYLRYVNKWKEG